MSVRWALKFPEDSLSFNVRFLSNQLFHAPVHGFAITQNIHENELMFIYSLMTNNSYKLMGAHINLLKDFYEPRGRWRVIGFHFVLSRRGFRLATLRSHKSSSRPIFSFKLISLLFAAVLALLWTKTHNSDVSCPRRKTQIYRRLYVRVEFVILKFHLSHFNVLFCARISKTSNI